MKKGGKIALVSVSSLVVLLLVVVGIALYTVLSPTRLTKLVNKEAPRFITCEFHLQKANLTFFKTFPKIGLDIQHLLLLNPMAEAPSDTLLYVEHCTAALQIRELLKNHHLLIQHFQLKEGVANLFVNAEGENNYSVFKTDTTSTSSEFDYSVDLRKVEVSKVNLCYVDRSSNMSADLSDIGLWMKGWMEEDDIQGKVKLNTSRMALQVLDSLPLKVHYDDLAFRFDGDLSKLDQLEGDVSLDVKQLQCRSGEDSYLDSVDLSLSSLLSLSLNNQSVSLKSTQINLDKYGLTLEGSASRHAAAEEVEMDIRFDTESWPLRDFLAMIPKALIGDVLDDMDLDGMFGLTGTVKGRYSADEMPVVDADVIWQEGSLTIEKVPLSLHKINTVVHMDMDLGGQTNVEVKSLDGYMGDNHLSATLTIQDLLNRMLFDVDVTGDLQLADFQQFFPAELSRCEAEAQAKVQAQFDLAQLTNLSFDQMTANAQVKLKEVDVVYDDSLMVQSPAMTVTLSFPASDDAYDIGEWAAVQVEAQSLSGSKVGMGDLSAEDMRVDLRVNNLLDSTISPNLVVKFNFGSLSGQMDTMYVYLYKPDGTFVMQNSEKLSLQYSGETIVAKVGEMLSAQVGAVDLTASTNYNEKESHLLMRWNPDVAISFSEGKVEVNGLSLPVEIPSFKADLTTQKLDIHSGSVKLGNSDFSMTGQLTNMDQYFQGQDLLSGELNLTSEFIDINQVMDLVSGFGAPDSLLAEEPLSSENDPFMVPYGMNIRLNTHIQKALFEEAYVRNVGGYVSLKDGILVLDEMGFTSDAARMQLTALYKSPRKNHLFLGLDFHLLDIKIDKLIEMIPEVDTVLPMLKSFAGNAEFHFAIETYLKSNYDVKFSTLRGAAAINGKDLVVLDEETYAKISKLLRFKKGTTNQIDSLSAEATIFKNEVDVYPFALTVDKYQAVLSGRHNLDMTYNYNISLLKPIRLGLDIIGTDKRKFKLGRAKYATMFNPERQNVVEQNVLQLKQQINEALKANVKEQPTEENQ